MLTEIRMRDGTFYKGHIEKQNDSLIYLKSNGGVELIIPKKNVAAVNFINGYVRNDSVTGSQVHVAGIYSYYYTTTSNSFLFNKGELYGSNNYLAFLSINYAFTRNFSLGIATSVIGVPMGLHAKANFELSRKLYLGFEAVGGSMMYLNPKTWGSGGTLKLTSGDEHNNFTLYAGYFDAEFWVKPKKRRGNQANLPLYSAGNYYLSFSSGFAGIAYAARLSEKVHFVADAFIFPVIQIYTASIGVRGSSKQKISWSGGWQFIVNKVPSVNRTYPTPYIGFGYRL